MEYTKILAKYSRAKLVEVIIALGLEDEYDKSKSNAQLRDFILSKDSARIQEVIEAMESVEQKTETEFEQSQVESEIKQEVEESEQSQVESEIQEGIVAGRNNALLAEIKRRQNQHQPKRKATFQEELDRRLGKKTGKRTVKEEIEYRKKRFNR